MSVTGLPLSQPLVTPEVYDTFSRGWVGKCKRNHEAYHFFPMGYFSTAPHFPSHSLHDSDLLIAQPSSPLLSSPSVGDRQLMMRWKWITRPPLWDPSCYFRTQPCLRVSSMRSPGPWQTFKEEEQGQTRKPQEWDSVCESTAIEERKHTHINSQRESRTGHCLKSRLWSCLCPVSVIITLMVIVIINSIYWALTLYPRIKWTLGHTSPHLIITTTLVEVIFMAML